MEDFIRNRRTNEREAAYAAIGAIKSKLLHEVFNDGGDFERLKAVIRVKADANVPETTDDIRAIEGVITVKQTKPIEDASGERSIAVLAIKYDKRFADDDSCVKLFERIKEIPAIDLVVLKDSSDQDISLIQKDLDTSETPEETDSKEKRKSNVEPKQENFKRGTLMEALFDNKIVLRG
jgi:hypothetical protein